MISGTEQVHDTWGGMPRPHHPGMPRPHHPVRRQPPIWGLLVVDSYSLRPAAGRVSAQHTSPQCGGALKEREARNRPGGSIIGRRGWSAPRRFFNDFRD